MFGTDATLVIDLLIYIYKDWTSKSRERITVDENRTDLSVFLFRDEQKVSIKLAVGWTIDDAWKILIVSVGRIVPGSHIFQGWGKMGTQLIVINRPILIALSKPSSD